MDDDSEENNSFIKRNELGREASILVTILIYIKLIDQLERRLFNS